MITLPPHTPLQDGRYILLRVLGQGGFGITYLAFDNASQRYVAVKEFFMETFCIRYENTPRVVVAAEGSAVMVYGFREKFLKEAYNLYRLDHPSIVHLYDVFEENATAYYVMEYLEGGSLSDRVQSQGPLPEAEAARYMVCIAKAVEYIHQFKMNHLDIKPDNIMVNSRDEAILIDFGLSKQYDTVTGEATSVSPVALSDGYAPLEQYIQNGIGSFSPETDIYALGATFYFLLTGTAPPNASTVTNDGLPVAALEAARVSPMAISVITMAMEGLRKDRMKNVRALIIALERIIAAGASSTGGHQPGADPIGATQPFVPAGGGVVPEPGGTGPASAPQPPVPPHVGSGQSSLPPSRRRKSSVRNWAAYGAVFIVAICLGVGAFKFTEYTKTNQSLLPSVGPAVEEAGTSTPGDSASASTASHRTASSSSSSSSSSYSSSSSSKKRDDHKADKKHDSRSKHHGDAAYDGGEYSSGYKEKPRTEPLKSPSHSTNPEPKKVTPMKETPKRETPKRETSKKEEPVVV